MLGDGALSGILLEYDSPDFLAVNRADNDNDEPLSLEL